MKALFFLFILLIPTFRCIPAEKDYVLITLGESCVVTGAIEALNLRQASYPFEHCITPFRGLFCSIENDFYDYVNPDYFTPYIDNQSPVNKYGIVLAHSFPLVSLGLDEKGNEKFILDPDWRKALPTIQEKYARRTDRFRASCQSGKKVYFVRHCDITSKDASNFTALINSLYPNLDFTLICILHGPPPKQGSVWNIPRVMNYYIDNTAGVSEWRRVFLDVGLISLNNESN